MRLAGDAGDAITTQVPPAEIRLETSGMPFYMSDLDPEGGASTELRKRGDPTEAGRDVFVVARTSLLSIFRGACGELRGPLPVEAADAACMPRILRHGAERLAACQRYCLH